MKKNGKKYRRIQKEKEQRRFANINNVKICQEVDEINVAYLSMSNVITQNPILNDSLGVKKEYISILRNYIRMGDWNQNKYESASLVAYENIILKDESDICCKHNISYYQYFILLDFISILAMELKKSDMDKLERVKERYYQDFKTAEKSVAEKIFKCLLYPEKNLKQLLREGKLKEERFYLRIVLENVLFKKREPMALMVTATMSAGKSTFINALIGKYICLSQNMACTSKIHFIVNKTFEDGLSAEYDHDLILTAGKEELLNDNELNSSDKIVVGTHFYGELSSQRIIINDSPGVNFSGDDTHKEITHRLIREKNYNFLLYVMNATQLSTNDESEHLDFVKRIIGQTPIIFIINKIDAFNVEEEDIEKTVRRQKEMLIKKGFKNPIICPVSARAGYLAKKSMTGGLSRSEERELYNYVDKFEQMKLSAYYANEFKTIRIADSNKEEEQLLKTCGLLYVEKIIMAMCKGGSKNGSGIYKL